MMDKAAKIYIAGHRGLVGSAIWRTLEAEGYKKLLGKSSAELDLTDQAATEGFFAAEQPDYVYLAAARVGGIAANNTYRADFIQDNLDIQNNVVRASFQNDVKKLLFLGSSCIYPKEAPQPITEDALLTGPLEYTNEPYAIAKIAGIKLIESYNLQHGTNYLAVMPTNLYGRGDNFDLEKSHVMPGLIRKTFLAKLLEDGDLPAIAANLGLAEASEEELLTELTRYGIAREVGGVTLTAWGTGRPRREFLHVDDLAEACTFVMNNVDFADVAKDKAEIRNTHLNVGTGSDLAIEELAKMIKELVGFGGQLAFDPTKPDGTMRKLLSVDKLNRLGWRHKIELADGLAATVKWYSDNHLSAAGPSHLDDRQGAAEERSEAYMKYVERAPQAATQSGAKSTSGAAGTAGKQAGGVRRSDA